jgi:plastocyanin
MKRLIQTTGLAALALIAVACGGGSPTQAPATGGPAASAPASAGNEIVAKDVAFQTQALTVKAGTPTEIVLDNEDSAPHNLAIKDGSGATLFKGEIVTGAKVSNAIPALGAGSYTFFCEVHPNMTGTLTVQ